MGNSFSVHIGKQIRIFRKNQKMSLEELACRINKSKATLSKYESGSIILDVVTLNEIAHALRLPINFLIGAYDSEKHAANDLHSLPAHLFFYNLKIKGNGVDHACVDIIPGEKNPQVIFYLGVHPDEKDKASLIYTGHAIITDTTLALIASNTVNKSDQLFFTATRPYLDNNYYFTGLYLALDFEPVIPACAKGVISTKPIDDQELLKKLLQMTDYEIAKLKKRNRMVMELDNY